MTPETKERLDYLRQLYAKYGCYFGKYFGFTMKQMADYMGMGKTGISAIVRGKYDITPDREQAFNKMFEEFRIIERSKDFVESHFQIDMRKHWAEQKKSLDK